MKNSPLVSVIIPLYNKAEYIRDTLESVLSQTYQNIEIIIVNDGSTDNSLEIVELLSANEKRIQLYSQNNKGVSAARNLGLKFSKGEIIQFLDADDVLAPNKIEEQLKYISPKTLTICRWGYGINGILQMQDNNLCNRSYDNGVQFICDLAQSAMPQHSWLIHRDLILNSGLWREDLTCGEDTEFFLRIITNAKSIVFCINTYVIYNKVESGLTATNKSHLALNSILKSRNYMIDSLINIEDSKRTRRALAIFHSYLLLNSYANASDIFNIALKQAISLGYSNYDLPFKYSRIEQLSRFIGIRNTLFLQSHWLNLKFKFSKIINN